MFLFRENRQADQSRCPPFPDGFPVIMLTYDQWLDERGMHPRQVDQLSRGELFWLPVVREAKAAAIAALSDKK